MHLQAFYSVRSERQLMERLDFDLLFRWFVGLTADEPAWNASTFSKNRERLLSGQIVARFFAAALDNPRIKRLLSTEHFSVEGTLIDAWAGMRSFQPKEAGDGRRRDGDCRGDRRLNSTHASTTDADARLYRKEGQARAALLHGSRAHGKPQRAGGWHACDAGEWDRRTRSGARHGRSSATRPWGDAGRRQGLPPMALQTGAGLTRLYGAYGAALRYRVARRQDHPTTRPRCLAMRPQADRGDLRLDEDRRRPGKTKFRGRSRVAQGFQLAVAAYNLIRIPKLLIAERLT